MQNQNTTVEQLIAVGGSEWQRGNNHRVYFNDLAGLYGLSTNHYNTGNISSARLHGEKISNSRARELSNTLRTAKLWYDVAESKFMAIGLEPPMMQIIIGTIRDRVAETDER